MSDSDRLDALAEALRLATVASRVTIRFAAGERFPVTAESCARGVASLRDAHLDPRGSATFEYLSRERRILVQDDVSRHDLAPPAELVAAYGIRAQMVAPVVVRDELRALVSVHESKGARTWTSADRQALARAASDVARFLG
jgi:maleate isomerase